MSPARAPAPVIEGFTLEKPLGSGGFADVFLYQQHLPDREVAVKVLHEGVTANNARAFTAEANLMAKLSTHPSIVTIFQAGIASAGRPYLVMEYYPRPNLSVRSRSRPLPVDDALDILIRVSGAVETAHRAGIIHRDIKPANILTSAYGKPGLTDFGISAAKTDVADHDSGLSIPWCAPEVIEGLSNGDERSDVYSLAATLYTLLAGRSPFEVTGQRNSHVDLIARISSGAPVPLTRTDIPIGLLRVISMGLDRDPQNRPGSAAEFARLLQEVEVQMHLAMTPLDVLGDAPVIDDPEPDDDGATRIRGATVVRPTGPRPGAALINQVAEIAPERARVRPLPPRSVPGAPDVADTVQRSSAPEAPREGPEPVEPPRRTASWARWAAGAAVALVGAIIVTAVVMGGGGDAKQPVTQPTFDQDPLPASVPAPQDLSMARTAADRVTATWSIDEPQAGDFFQVKRTDKAQQWTVDEPTLLIDGLTAAERPCLSVWLVRAGQQSASPASACSGA